MNALPILCYHAIESGPGPLCITPDEFRRHVAVLAGRVQTLSIAQVVEHIKSGRPFPDDAVAITFDDAYTSVYDNAYPALASAGLTATIFVVTAHIGGRAEWNEDPRERLPLMGADEIRELHAHGWEIGSHTHRHLALPTMDEGDLLADVRRSVADLQDLVGGQIRAFAYPYGAFDQRSRALVAGEFDGCVTIGARFASMSSAPDAIERIDAWYVRGGWLRALGTPVGTAYLAARRLARDARKKAMG